MVGDDSALTSNPLQKYTRYLREATAGPSSHFWGDSPSVLALTVTEVDDEKTEHDKDEDVDDDDDNAITATAAADDDDAHTIHRSGMPCDHLLGTPKSFGTFVIRFGIVSQPYWDRVGTVGQFLYILLQL